MQKTTRRRFLAAATVLPLFSILPSRASAAEFRLKFATGQDPSHPVNKRAQEAIDRIKAATDGRVEISLFPANQLGSDTDLIGQLRFGAVDFLNIAGSF
jgi:TRAP-type C4-dicarboxylate transport system substrate-binding protein